MLKPSNDSQSPPGGKQKSKPNWEAVTSVKRQEAIEQTKKQIQTKTTKNIAVALNTFVGKNNRNPAAAIEKMLNMKKVAAIVEHAQVTNPDEIEALKDKLE